MVGGADLTGGVDTGSNDGSHKLDSISRRNLIDCSAGLRDRVEELRCDASFALAALVVVAIAGPATRIRAGHGGRRGEVESIAFGESCDAETRFVDHVDELLRRADVSRLEHLVSLVAAYCEQHFGSRKEEINCERSVSVPPCWRICDDRCGAACNHASGQIVDVDQIHLRIFADDHQLRLRDRFQIA